MIGFLGVDAACKKMLRQCLSQRQVKLQNLPLGSASNLHQLYKNIHVWCGLVAEAEHPQLPQAAWLDLLDSLSVRIPVVIVGRVARKDALPVPPDRTGRCRWLVGATAEDIVQALASLGAMGVQPAGEESIPLYTPTLALDMLQHSRSMSLLVIQTAGFRSIAIEYGQETYEALRACFQQFLLESWGEKGSFRAKDFLCKAGLTSSDYYILLERSRTDQGVPPPGALERMADRLYIRLQNLFWTEIFRSGPERRLPSLLRTMPAFSVGYASASQNPCLDGLEIIERAVESSRKVSEVHQHRMEIRKRELVQNVIEKEGLLAPQYQAVFHLKNLPLRDVEAAVEGNTILPLAPFLYAFESLIRINVQLVNQLLEQEAPIHLDANHLKPDVLFAIAHEVKLSLELDQTCLRKAISHFQGVPGKLLANIMPRNFYHIEQFQSWFSGDQEIIFEVSESEVIRNLSLLLEAKAKLSHRRFSIAIDDFGMGYAGLDRILEIRPEVVKLDRSLIENIHEEKPKQAYVKGLVDTTRMTKSLLLAEGVEKMEELRVLQDLGVELVQGFLLHRPQPIEVIQAALYPSGKSKYPSAA